MRHYFVGPVSLVAGLVGWACLRLRGCVAVVLGIGSVLAPVGVVFGEGMGREVFAGGAVPVSLSVEHWSPSGAVSVVVITYGVFGLIRYRVGILSLGFSTRSSALSLGLSAMSLALSRRPSLSPSLIGAALDHRQTR